MFVPIINNNVVITFVHGHCMRKYEIYFIECVIDIKNVYNGMSL